MRKIRWTLAVIAVLAVIFTACGKKEKRDSGKSQDTR